MSDPTRRARGEEMIKKVYAGDVVVPPAGASAFADTMLEQFEDTQAGGFFFTSHDHEELVLRPKPGHDNATPSGNAVAAWALQRLTAIAGEERYAQSARRTLELFFPAMRAHAGGFASMAMALAEVLEPPATLILRGEARSIEGWAAEITRELLPDTIVLALADGLAQLPAVLDKPARPGGVNAWLCRGVTCLQPITELDGLKRACKQPGLR